MNTSSFGLCELSVLGQRAPIVERCRRKAPLKSRFGSVPMEASNGCGPCARSTRRRPRFVVICVAVNVRNDEHVKLWLSMKCWNPVSVT